MRAMVSHAGAGSDPGRRRAGRSAERPGVASPAPPEANLWMICVVNARIPDPPMVVNP
jgi:hypothetical protein